MNNKIEAWIDRLDKYNICPYAAKSRRCIVEGDYNNLVEYIQTWDDSTSPNKGYITIQSNINGNATSCVFLLNSLICLLLQYLQNGQQYLIKTCLLSTYNNDVLVFNLLQHEMHITLLHL